MDCFNGDSTKKTIKSSKSDYWVHGATFDRISKILIEREIQSAGFASFSDGMPRRSMHGEANIIFRKNSLMKKGCEFLKVDYSEEFLKRCPEIADYIFEKRTKDETRKWLMNEYDHQIKLSEIYFNHDPMNAASYSRKIDSLIVSKQDAEKNPIEHFLKIVRDELEILTKGPLTFSKDDVFRVILYSRTFNNYFPIPGEYENKIIYLEDFHPIILKIRSPLGCWLSNEDPTITNIHEERIKEILYLISEALLIHPSWSKFIKINSGREINPVNLPKKWDCIFKNMHLIKNDERKVEAIGFVFEKYILNLKLRGDSQVSKEYESILLDTLNDRLN